MDFIKGIKFLKAKWKGKCIPHVLIGINIVIVTITMLSVLKPVLFVYIAYCLNF